MKPIVYRPDGCVDFLTTKAVREGTALTPAELEELNLSYSSESLEAWDRGEVWDCLLPKDACLKFNQSVLNDIQKRNQSKSEEFWSDPCWTEPLFSDPI